jgi:hypothetical protein
MPTDGFCGRSKLNGFAYSNRVCLPHFAEFFDCLFNVLPSHFDLIILLAVCATPKSRKLRYDYRHPNFAFERGLPGLE